MNRMKKIVCFALLCLLLAGAAACGSTEQSTPSGASTEAAPSESGKDSAGLSVFAEYADPSEQESNSLFFFDKENPGYLVRIRATEELKHFRFIEVVDDGPYAGKTLFSIASLAPGRSFYAETVIGEGFSVRGIAFEDANGETVCYRINYDGRGEAEGPAGFTLEPIPASPAG